MGKLKPRTEVFLNLPYDSKFQNLYVSYICAIYAFGMVPRVTLEIPGGARRLDRIFSLIQGCSFSIHDLSRVELDRQRPRTPRFNMPFELGLTVGWNKTRRSGHVWFVMEAKDYRLEKSLSDLKGTDPYIHDGTIEGVFREIGNAFVRQGMQPTVPEMRSIYRHVKAGIPAILRRCGTASVFQARTFREISIAASAAANGICRIVVSRRLALWKTARSGATFVESGGAILLSGAGASEVLGLTKAKSLRPDPGISPSTP